MAEGARLRWMYESSVRIAVVEVFKLNIGCGIAPPFSTPTEESGGQGRICLKNPCISSNRLPWLWPYPWRQSATNLIFCVPGPSKCWRLGVCFPSEHSRLQSPLHTEAFPRRALPAGRQFQWDLIPVRGGESDRKSTRLNSSHLGISY